MLLCQSGVFEAHSCQPSVDSSPQGKEENERFGEQQENRYENTFRAEQALSVRDNKGWDKTVYYLKNVILPSNLNPRQQHNVFLLNGRGLSGSLCCEAEEVWSGSKPTTMVRVVGLSALIWTQMR